MEESIDSVETVDFVAVMSDAEHVGSVTRSRARNITNVSQDSLVSDDLLNDSTSSVMPSVDDFCEIEMSLKRRNTKNVAEDNAIQKSKSMKMQLDQKSSFSVGHHETDLQNKAGILDNKITKKLNIHASKLTLVQPFHFKTDERLKSISQPNHSYEKFDFASCLRRCSPRSKSDLGLKATRPRTRSFNVSARKNRHEEKQIDQQLHTNANRPQLRVTRPRSPELHAVQRNRPITVLSREQMEEMEIEEQKKWKFQAKPFDPKLFERSMLVKTDAAVSKTSKAKELKIEKLSKSKNIQPNKNDTEEYVFRAQPVPKIILEGIVGLKKKVTLPLTEPKTPRFSIRTRSQKMKNNVSPVENKKKIIVGKIRTASHSVEPLSVTVEKKCATEIKPFSFDEVDKVRFSEKSKKIEQEIQKKKTTHKFKANPMPITSSLPTGVPVVLKKSPTQPEPFNLQSYQLNEKWNKSEDSLNTKLEVAKFKARPATVVQKPPFQPQKSTKPLTAINTFHLNTEKRAKEWANLVEAKKQISAENEIECQRLKEEEERKEREEITELRKQQVHKANPVRIYQPIAIKSSIKSLTEPCSPKLMTTQRINRRI